jgi:hypothetical protein
MKQSTICSLLVEEVSRDQQCGGVPQYIEIVGLLDQYRSVAMAF